MTQIERERVQARIASNRAIEVKVAPVIAAQKAHARAVNVKKAVKAFRALNRALIAYDGVPIPVDMQVKFYKSCQ